VELTIASVLSRSADGGEFLFVEGPEVLLVELK
jgi:hypothetical protein